MAEINIVSTANNNFTVSLYQALFPPVSLDNLIFSPFSLHAVLGMVGQGARGTTRTELLKGLKFEEDKNDEVIAKSYNSVISSFQSTASPETFTLLTANRVYSQVGFGLNRTFVKRLKTHFYAEFEQLNFSSSAKCKAAAEKINQWVEDTTNNKIKNVISQDDLGRMTGLVLINCIYFKGLWEHKFHPAPTFKRKFNVTGSKQVTVDMMHRQEWFPYGELPKLDAKAVALPYKGGRLSMVIILPKAVDGLAKIQSSIGNNRRGGSSFVGKALSNWDNAVAVSLPKFKVETTIENLTGVLQNLGIKSMFSPTGADFGGIPDGANPDLFVSCVIQKAFIEVSEEGAEAAAVTVTGIKRGSTGPPRKTMVIPFVVDRPFCYQIVDHANEDLVLFSGHVNDPTL